MPVLRVPCRDLAIVTMLEGRAVLGSRFVKKLASLGHTRGSSLQWMQFTSTYSSPERSNGADQRKVDVWAAGCILYELCTGMSFMRPQRGGSIYTLMAQLQDPNWSAPEDCLPRCMSCWRPMMNAMLCRDPAQRPLPRELLAFDVLKCASFLCRHATSHAFCENNTGARFFT